MKDEEQIIKDATEAILDLFPGCQLWKREGDMVYAPDTDEAVYLPLADVMKLRCPDGNHEMIGQILSVHHGVQWSDMSNPITTFMRVDENPKP